MITFKKLKIEDYKFFKELILSEGNAFIEYIELGWSINEIKNQLNKTINLSYGVFYKNTLISFMLGDLFCVEKLSEYELFLIYVCKNFRNKGIGTKLLNKIGKTENKYLKKIYLEVSKKNTKGISFYKKMNFKKTYTRKNYYLAQKEKMDALIFVKNF